MLNKKILANRFKNNDYFRDLNVYVNELVDIYDIPYAKLKYLYNKLYKGHKNFVRQNIHPVGEFLKDGFSIEEAEKIASLLEDATNLTIFCISKEKGYIYNKLFYDLSYAYYKYAEFIKSGYDEVKAIDKLKASIENTSIEERQNIMSKILDENDKEYYIENKLRKFYELCGDWDFRNIDMTNAHLECINIDFEKNIIEPSCEWFSTDLDDYVFCKANKIKNKKLIKKFEDLNLDDTQKVRDFINKIENNINWDKVIEELSIETNHELIKENLGDLDLENTVSVYENLKQNTKYEAITLYFNEDVISQKEMNYIKDSVEDNSLIELNAYKNLENNDLTVYLVLKDSTGKNILKKVDITNSLNDNDKYYIMNAIEERYHWEEEYAR